MRGCQWLSVKLLMFETGSSEGGRDDVRTGGFAVAAETVEFTAGVLQRAPFPHRETSPLARLHAGASPGPVEFPPQKAYECLRGPGSRVAVRARRHRSHTPACTRRCAFAPKSYTRASTIQSRTRSRAHGAASADISDRIYLIFA